MIGGPIPTYGRVLPRREERIHAWLRNTPEGQTGFRYIEDASSKQALSVFATMMQYTAAFEYMSQAESNFSVTEWLSNDKPGFIFVTNQSDLKDTLKPYPESLHRLPRKETSLPSRRSSKEGLLPPR